MVKIYQEGEEILNKVAKEIPLNEIGSDKIQNLISTMKDILKGTDDAVALAAPQIGESLRLFVISKKIFGENDGLKDLVFINPEITKTSKNKVWAEEGCLSVRGIYGEVERFKKATIKAYDEDGKKFTFGGSGLLAQAFQHEADHLDGILFTSKARSLHKEDIGKKSL